MIEFEIDGKKFSSEPGKTIIEVADSSGIYIPRFCYHKKLSVAANCRMCLVEVEKSGKPLPACATPVTAGMKVFTRSPKAVAAQRSVMEFLLINHPLDCPICDQGGECELQDLSLGYGKSTSRYRQGKRSVDDKDLGPLVASFMTRCIQCTRCVRFGEEVSGMRELGAYNRGENLEIGTYVQRTIKSELSGNIIDICPVGALTSKPFQYQARAWEMIQHPSIAAHDCVGSNIYVHTRSNEYSPYRTVMRVVPRANEAINEVWLSNQDRFSYTALEHPDRVTKPKRKVQGLWQEIDWPTAIEHVTQNLKNINSKHGAKKIGAIASPNSTLEEFYLLQKLMRGIGSNNVDYRIHELDFSIRQRFSLYPSLGMSFQDIENLDTILLIGSYPRDEQPLINHRIRKATLQDAQVFCINPVDYAFNYDITDKAIVNIFDLPYAIAQLAKTVSNGDDVSANAKHLFEQIEIGKAQQTFAKKFKQGKNIGIFIGPQALHHPQASEIVALVNFIAQHTQAKVGVLTHGANSAGAWLAGAVPHQGPIGEKIATPGLGVKEMFENPLAAYLLMNVEPEFDFACPPQALAALKKADFVVMFSTFSNLQMEEYADVILPIAPFTENAGTYVNAEGLWQRFEPVGPCLDETRPAWKILRALGSELGLEGFTYTHAHEIHKQLWPLVDPAEAQLKEEKKKEIKLPKQIKKANSDELFRMGEWPLYRIDNLVRRAQPLQESMDPTIAAVRINSAVAAHYQFQSGDPVVVIQNQQEIILPCIIDDGIPNGNVYLPAALIETAGFGEIFGKIELRSAKRG